MASLTVSIKVHVEACLTVAGSGGSVVNGVRLAAEALVEAVA